MSPITTHVLDTSTGSPASGLAVTLEYETREAVWQKIADAVTDAEGRVKSLMPPATELSAGHYRLIFNAGEYFHIRQVECFFSKITVAFVVDDNKQHFHVPLLLSPFSYSTYRGT